MSSQSKENGDGRFPNLGLGTEMPEAINAVFDRKSIVDEAILYGIRSDERLIDLTADRFDNPDAAEEAGRKFTRELNEALAAVGVLKKRVVIASPEIIYRRTYTRSVEGERSSYEMAEVDLDPEEIEDLEPSDPNELKDGSTENYRRTGELALLPASKSHPLNFAVDSGELEGIYFRVLEVDNDNEDDPQLYRVALYYCVSRGMVGDVFERRIPCTLTNITKAEIKVDQNTEIEDFKSALMILANLDDDGQPQGSPMVDRHQLASLLDNLTTGFDSRFDSQNIKEIHQQVCALQVEYRGDKRDLLIHCLERLLNASFRVSPDTYFYIKTHVGIKYKETNVGGYDFTATETHKGAGTMKGPVRAIVLRDTPVPNVAAPHVDILVEKTADGRPLKEEYVSGWYIPFTGVDQMSSSFSTE